jgi:nucleotide-binding universal stress UspA family protein
LRTLLILDGTNYFDEALDDAKALCDPGDKLTVLAVAEKPAPAVLGYEPSPTNIEPYTGVTIGRVGVGPDLPVLESEDDTDARVAGELRDSLDEHAAKADTSGIDVWTQAIVRDEPGEAVAEYVRSSDIDRIVFPRSALQRLREMLKGHDGMDAIEGRLAPVIVLPT